MRKIYTGIEMGRDSIKIVVLEKLNNSFNLLASSKVKSLGIKRNEIVDSKKLIESVNDAIKEIEEKLNVTIKKVIASIPSKNSIFDIVSGETKVKDYLNISGEDIKEVLRCAIVGNIKDGYELVTALPINFKIDDKSVVKDPKGLQGNKLSVKAVITEIPKDYLYKYLGVLDLCGLEVEDICFGTIGDYFEVRNNNLDNKVGAIINIGEDSTNVSIYNKGIMIKNSIINVGSYYVDHDISYIYNINMEEARNLKENFSVCSSRYADSNDKMDLITTGGTKYNISQLDITKIVEARVEEILKVSKKEIKNLTNRKISYIIILGGLSEMVGFSSVLENVFGNLAYVYNNTTMGIRNNSYTSVLGIIKYYDNKLELRDAECNMFDTDDIKNMIATKGKNEGILNRVLGNFEQNKEDKVC